MNELYAADPSVFGHSSELRMLLGLFGPYAGRYLANYPSDWSSQVEAHSSQNGDIESARVSALIRRARESLALITKVNLPWVADLGWLENAELLAHGTETVFDGLIAEKSDPPNIHQLDDLMLPPTADERVQGTVAEYRRISRILLLLSPEIAFVDPYLNPLKADCARVLEGLFKVAAMGKAQQVILWTRASVIFGSMKRSVIMEDMTKRLREMTANAKFKDGRKVLMLMMDDESKATKMHGRYLLSIKGGIRLDQGFQQLSAGRKVDVGPIGRAIHSDLLDIYFEDKHEMTVVEQIQIIA